MATRLTAASATAVLLCLATSAPAARAQAQEGERLFQEACASCHGAGGEGTELGPSLAEAGAAAADFQLRTGRMPLSDPDRQAMRKPPAFDAEAIAALVAYVDSLGQGPAIPDVDIEGADLAVGQELFTANCVSCHGATGTGGAAGGSALAPSLLQSQPLDVAEATMTGPGQMPVFDFTPHERDAVAAFVAHLQTAEDPGGADIGGVGPVPEGFVAWMIGATTLTLVCVFIGRRRPPEDPGR